jgi:DNA (cytosine-5)-methyltransferase 1
VDINSQPRYVGDEFHQADALDYPLDGFDAIHASPPCQAHSTLGSLWKDRTHDDLVPATRAILQGAGLPYVIENVIGAPLLDPLLLCGSMFGLGANGRQLRRHRIFESNVFVMRPSCQHRGQPVGVYGHGGGGDMTRGYKGTKQEYVDAMEMAWATKAEIAQAIPPAYTEHIGGYLRTNLASIAEKPRTQADGPPPSRGAGPTSLAGAGAHPSSASRQRTVSADG